MKQAKPLIAKDQKARKNSPSREYPIFWINKKKKQVAMEIGPREIVHVAYFNEKDTPRQMILFAIDLVESDGQRDILLSGFVPSHNQEFINVAIDAKEVVDSWKHWIRYAERHTPVTKHDLEPTEQFNE